MLDREISIGEHAYSVIRDLLTVGRTSISVGGCQLEIDITDVQEIELWDEGKDINFKDGPRVRFSFAEFIARTILLKVTSDTIGHIRCNDIDFEFPVNNPFALSYLQTRTIKINGFHLDFRELHTLSVEMIDGCRRIVFDKPIKAAGRLGGIPFTKHALHLTPKSDHLYLEIDSMVDIKLIP